MNKGHQEDFLRWQETDYRDDDGIRAFCVGLAATLYFRNGHLETVRRGALECFAEYDALRGESLSASEGSPLAVLTPREREVFQLLALGKANKEVASMLDLSLGTVKKHRENLQRKLECHSAAELARLAIREGLLEP